MSPLFDGPYDPANPDHVAIITRATSDILREPAADMSFRAESASPDRTYWIDFKFDPDDPRQLVGHLWEVTTEGTKKKKVLVTDQLTGQLHPAIPFESAIAMKSVAVTAHERDGLTNYLVIAFVEPDGTSGRTCIMSVEGQGPRPPATA
jgi:hypothetical protein